MLLLGVGVGVVPVGLAWTLLALFTCGASALGLDVGAGERAGGVNAAVLASVGAVRLFHYHYHNCTFAILYNILYVYVVLC